MYDYENLNKGMLMVFVLFGSRDLVRIMPLLFGWKIHTVILKGVVEDAPRIMKAWTTLTLFWTFCAAIFSIGGGDSSFILQFVKLGIIGSALSLIANFACSKKPNAYVPEE